MLVIGRKIGERLLIGSNIVVTVLRHRPDGKVTLGIDAPPHIAVCREELLAGRLDEIIKQNKTA